MADNVTYASGVPDGTVQRADDVGAGVLVPYAKLMDGTDGSGTVIAAGNGAAAGALRVAIASDGDAVVKVGDNGGSITTDTPQLPAALAAGGGLKVEGVAGGVAVPVSAAALPLPSGAATAAKQPALGTAGTPSSDVLSIQGVASGVAVKTDGSATTQPVSGTVTVQDGGGSVTVDGTVSVSGLVPGTAATSLGKAEDAAAGDGDTGVMALAVRKDTAATTVGADGDYHPLLVDGNGRLHVNGSGVTQPVSGTVTVQDGGGALSIDDGGGSITVDAPVGTPLFVRLSDGTAAISTLPVSLASVPTHGVAGDVAHDAADSGAPVKVGAKATTALSGATLVADADRTDLRAGVDGVLITRKHCNLEDIVTGNASNTDGTSTSLIAAQGVGVKTYLTKVTLTNTSATMCYVEIKDGSTVKHTIPVPATGGATVDFDPPLPGTANTAWNFDPSAATTTVIASAVGFKSKV